MKIQSLLIAVAVCLFYSDYSFASQKITPEELVLELIQTNRVLAKTKSKCSFSLHSDSLAENSGRVIISLKKNDLELSLALDIDTSVVTKQQLSTSYRDTRYMFENSILEVLHFENETFDSLITVAKGSQAISCSFLEDFGSK